METASNANPGSPYILTGGVLSMFANRISFHFDFKGKNYKKVHTLIVLDQNKKKKYTPAYPVLERFSELAGSELTHCETLPIQGTKFFFFFFFFFDHKIR